MRLNERSLIQRIWEWGVSAPLFSWAGMFRLFILWPMSFFYRYGLFISRLFSEKAERLAVPVVPVVSIGSLTVGGAGKTPCVELLVNTLLERGLRVGVVGSGYGRASVERVLQSGAELAGRDSGQLGDEIALLAGKLPLAVFAISDSKRTAVQELSGSGRVDIIIVDDGFQSRGLARDLNILLVNTQSAKSDYRMLPAGRLREPLSARRRADLIIFTKLAGENDQPPDWLSKKYPQESHKVAEVDPREPYRSWGRFELVSVSGESGQPSGRAFLVSGLADNSSFASSAGLIGVEIGGQIEFDDHFRYDSSWAERIESEAHKGACAYILTSEKDWTKLREFQWRIPVWLLVQQTEISDFENLIDIIISLTEDERNGKA